MVGRGVFKGEMQWWVDDQLHRVGGPAKVSQYGDKDWYFQGKRHRVGAPAVEWKDGRREWWQNGLRHRIDGPAEEFFAADGKTPLGRWWINGEKLRKVLSTRIVRI
jgi:hypothetical protein